ncbi:MAG: calcium/sodium antiporter [Bryobacterales bacterium]
MDTLSVAFLIAGLILLVAGAELLVRGAASLAAALKISPLVVGLTVVAYGTSAPELAVSVGATFSGQTDVALGNVVGSNIFNVLLILGLSAVVTPLVVAQKLVRFDVWVMIGASLLTYAMAWDLVISRLEGVLLLLGGVAYTAWLIWEARSEDFVSENNREFGAQEPGDSLARNIGFIVLGLVLLVLGSRWLVEGATTFARAMGISELVIGLTLVAGGTSLPELATSVLASLRGQRSIAVGNIVGSNIFNLFVVLGASGALPSGGVPVAASALALDIPIMVAVALACLPIFFTGYRIDRWEGFLFLGYYAAYTVYLILHGSRSEVLEAYAAAMLWFVLPLTVVTLLTVSLRAMRAK